MMKCQNVTHQRNFFFLLSFQINSFEPTDTDPAGYNLLLQDYKNMNVA